MNTTKMSVDICIAIAIPVVIFSYLLFESIRFSIKNKKSNKKV